jgi:hypothetical protein
MKTLVSSNRHIGTTSARKEGVERNVRSSSAVEGISVKTFRSAVTGHFATKGANSKTTHVNERSKKK